VNISSITTGANSIDTLIERFIAPERQPVNDLEAQKVELNRRSCVYTDLKSKLSALRDIAQGFTRVGVLNSLSGKKTILTNSTFFSIEASSSAELGTHSIKVERLATADTGISKQLDKDTVYEYATGLQEFTIAVGSGDPQTVRLTIEDTDTYEDVVQKMADAVNATGLDVSASVVHDTSGTVRLSIRSAKTGSDNTLVMTEINGSNILRKLKFLDKNGNRRQADGANGGFLIEDTADLDAKFNLNGIDIIKGTNEVADVLEGVTIKLLQANEPGDSPVSFSIKNDTENIKKEINEFIEKFNDALKYLNNKTKVDTVNFIRGDLTGDFVFSSLKYSMRSIVAGAVGGLQDGYPELLSQVGIELSREGEMSIKDSSKFEEALNGNIDHVIQLFTADEGIGAKMDDLLETFVSSGGRVDRSKKGITRQISSIDTRIKNYEARLVIRERSLRQQLTDLQRSLSILNSQQSIMQSYQAFNFQMLYGGNSGY